MILTLPYSLARCTSIRSSSRGSEGKPPILSKMSRLIQSTWSPKGNPRRRARRFAIEAITPVPGGPSSSSSLKAARAHPGSLRARRTSSLQEGGRRVSAWRNTNIGASAAAAPMFICTALPLGQAITTVPRERAKSPEPSTLPPSATITWHSSPCRTEAMARRRCAASSRHGMTTENSGLVPLTPPPFPVNSYSPFEGKRQDPKQRERKEHFRGQDVGR